VEKIARIENGVFKEELFKISLHTVIIFPKKSYTQRLNWLSYLSAIFFDLLVIHPHCLRLNHVYDILILNKPVSSFG
jgi:hypothetical protein